MRILQNFSAVSIHQSKMKFIPSRTNCTYDLAHRLPYDLRLRILQSKEMSGKLKKFIGTQSPAQCLLQKYISGTTAQTVRKNRYHFFFFCLTLLDFLIFLKILCTGLHFFNKKTFVSDTTWKTKSRRNSSETRKNISEPGRKVPESVNNHLKSFSSDWASFTNVEHLRWKLANVVAAQVIVICNKKLGK